LKRRAAFFINYSPFHSVLVKVAATFDESPSSSVSIQNMTQPCVLYLQESLIFDTSSDKLIPGERAWKCEASSDDEVRSFM